MSVELMAEVWRRNVGGTRQQVLLVLADHANDDGVCWPSANLVAWKIGCGYSTVRRVLRELRNEGTVEQLSDASAGRVPVYRLRLEGLAPKPPYQRGAQNEHPPAVRGAQPNTPRGVSPVGTEPPKEPSRDAASAASSPIDPRQDRRLPRTTGRGSTRRPVPVPVAELAVRILDYWQRRTGVPAPPHSTSGSVGSGVVHRLLEHPDLDADEHRRIIDATLARAWWEGRATAQVVYGNGRAFAAAQARAMPGGGRGVHSSHPDQAPNLAAVRERDRERIEAAKAEARRLGP